MIRKECIIDSEPADVLCKFYRVRYGLFIICSTGYDDKMTKKIAEFKGKVLPTS